MMKKNFLAVLMACLLAIPAYAEEIPNQVEEGTATKQETQVVVSTLDELQEAVAKANDGDVIELSRTIKMVGESISTDKDITIACSENFEDNAMFDLMGSSVIGLSFKGGKADQIFVVTDFQEQETIIQNCTFDGNSTSEAICVYGAEKENLVKVIDCEFKNCFRSAISARTSTDVVIDRCHIRETYAIDASGAVDSSGKVTLNDCIITGNSSFANAGVRCSGTLIVSGGQIQDNIIRTTDNGAAVDIFCSGIWSITDEKAEDAGYYDATTGEKLSLPVYESNVLAKLIYLKDEDAKKYFSFLSEPDTSESDDNNPPELPQEPTKQPEEEENSANQPEVPPQKPIFPPTGSGEDDNSEQTPEPPKESVDSEGAEDKGNSADEPETPSQPPQGEDVDNSDDNTPQSPEKPMDPSQGDAMDELDNNTDTTSDAPQRPQEPANSASNNMPPTGRQTAPRSPL